MHEAQLHEEKSFITLTYNEENLPPGGTLNPEHFVLFMKRLRKSLCAKKIRFYHCGEYGDELGRPHYHALIFGHSFPDKYQMPGKTKSGELRFRSPSLDKLWGMGNCEVGNVTLKSAAYCTGYIMKKINGQMAERHYQKLDLSTGEIHVLHPEYCTMSRMPGIGKLWYEKFKGDVFPHDYAVMSGIKSKVPTFYDKLLKKEDRDSYDDIKKNRKKKMQTRDVIRHSSPSRLAVRETVTKARINLYKRDL